MTASEKLEVNVSQALAVQLATASAAMAEELRWTACDFAARYRRG